MESKRQCAAVVRRTGVDEVQGRRQCAAVVQGRRHCAAVNCHCLIKSNQTHCLEHYKLYNPKYLGYKKIKGINKYLKNPSLLTSLSDKEILIVATKFHNAAHLRKEYQEYAFKPELRDEGHNNFILSLLEMSKILLKRLEPQKEANSESSSEEEEVSLDKRQETYLLIKEDVVDLEKVLQHYINQNVILLKEIEDNLFVFIDLIDGFLGDKPINVHSSDMLPLQICGNISLLLDETLKTYEASRGYFDFSRAKRIVRPPSVKLECLRHFELCLIPGMCPADYITETLNMISSGSIKHPSDILKQTSYPVEFLSALVDIILYERSDHANEGYIISFILGKDELLVDVLITPLKEIPKDVKVLISDKKKFKTVNLNK